MLLLQQNVADIEKLRKQRNVAKNMLSAKLCVLFKNFVSKYVAGQTNLCHGKQKL